MKSFYFNRHYNYFGAIVLASIAISIYLIARYYNIMGSINLALVPLMLSVFILGIYTGRPCLKIEDEYFEYRCRPFTKSYQVYIDDVTKVEVDGSEILVYRCNVPEPIKIKSSSFSRTQLPEVTHYFLNLGSHLTA